MIYTGAEVHLSNEEQRWPLHTALAWVMTRDKRFTNQAGIDDFSPYVPWDEFEELRESRQAWRLLFNDMKSGHVPVFGIRWGKNAAEEIEIPPKELEGLDWGEHNGTSALRIRAATQDEDEHLSLDTNLKFVNVQVSSNAMVMCYLQQDQPIAFSTTQIGIAERPDGPDYMALSAAAYWIATEGGTFRFFARDEAVWKSAYKALLTQIVGGNVKVVGRIEGVGFPKAVEGSDFSGIAVNYPYTETRDDSIFGDLPYLEPGQLVTTADWQRDNDSLRFTGVRIPVATHLQVSRPDIARLWPFGAVLEKTTEPQRVRSSQGKYLAVVKRLEEIYPKGVPSPPEAPRKAMIRHLLETTPALGGKLDEQTLQKAIDYYNERLSK